MILHIPPLTKIAIPAVSIHLTEMRVNAIRGVYRTFLRRTFVRLGPFGNSMIMSPSPIAFTGRPSAVRMSLGGMSRKVTKCFHAGEKCLLAPQSINAPCQSSGMLSVLATSTKSNVHTKATSTSDGVAMAVLAFSLFPFGFPFLTCCFGPWPSFSAARSPAIILPMPRFPAIETILLVTTGCSLLPFRTSFRLLASSTH